MQKKVCHLTSVHSIDDGRIFRKECTSLAANGFDVTLIACGNESFEEIKNGVKRISLNVPVKNRLQRFFKRSKAVYKKALEVNADIYHFHDPELLPLGLKLKRKGKKVIYDSHEDLPRQISYKSWIPEILKKPVAFISEVIENYHAKKMDGIITVSDHIKKRFDKLHHNVVICHNYASLNEFEKTSNWDIKHKNHVCYVGAISKIRGIYNIVEATQKANVKLEVAGLTQSQELLNKLNSYNVIYHGFADREKLKAIFNNCFVGLITFLPAPNHNYANPNKFFEYMAAGLPVIASNFITWKTIIDENELGITVNPENIEEIADAIMYLNQNKEIAKKMGENGRKAFEEKFNWQIEEKKLIELYKHI